MNLPPHYVIYCRELGDRKDITARHLRQHGIDPIMFEGIHGKTFGLKATHICDVDGTGKEWYISQGHIGLDLSHYMLWTHLWHAGHEYAVVMEDDVFIGPRYTEQLKQVWNDLPRDFDICYLGWLDEHQRTLRHFKGCLHKMDGVPFGTHAMLLSRQGIRKLLDTQRLCKMHIDVQIDRLTLPRANWYVCSPILARQRSQQGNWKPTV